MNIHDWGRPQAAKLLLQYSENSSSAPMNHHAERFGRIGLVLWVPHICFWPPFAASNNY